MKRIKLGLILLITHALLACIPVETPPLWTYIVDSNTTTKSNILRQSDNTFRKLYTENGALVSESYFYAGEATGESVVLAEDVAPTMFNRNSGVSYRLDQSDDELSIAKFDSSLSIVWRIDGSTHQSLLGDFSMIDATLSYSPDDQLITVVAGRVVLLINAEGQVQASKVLEDETKSYVRFLGESEDGTIALRQCETLYSYCLHSTLDQELNVLTSFESTYSYAAYSAGGFYSSSNKNVCRKSVLGEHEWCKDFAIYTNAKSIVYKSDGVYYLQVSKFGEEDRQVVIEKINLQGETVWQHQFNNVEDVSELRFTDHGLSFSHITRISKTPLYHLDFLYGGTQLRSYLQLTHLLTNGKIEKTLVMDHVTHRYYIKSIMPHISLGYYSEAGTARILDYLINGNNVVMLNDQSPEKVYKEGSLETISEPFIELSLYE